MVFGSSKDWLGNNFVWDNSSKSRNYFACFQFWGHRAGAVIILLFILTLGLFKMWGHQRFSGEKIKFWGHGGGNRILPLWLGILPTETEWIKKKKLGKYFISFGILTHKHQENWLEPVFYRYLIYLDLNLKRIESPYFSVSPVML